MKTKRLAAALVAATVMISTPVLAEVLDNDNKKVSYSIGLKYGEGISRDLSDLDLETFIMGIRHAFEGTTPLMEDAEVMKVITDYRTKRMQEQRKEQADAGAENIAIGKKFLAANKSKSGVKTTDSGLQYKVLSKGKGEKPGPDDTVKVHYHGTLVDGTVFDSSVERGEPISFPVKGVIPGWTEALQLMSVGSKWKLFIPSDLAYGERAAGPKIGPNSALIFEVELLGIE